MASLLLAAPPTASQSFILTAPPTASQSFILTPSVFFSKSQSLINTPSLLSTSATSLSTSHSAAALPFIHCGRGDKKTARGKRFKHSFGNARPKDKKKGRGPPRVPAPPLPPRKDKYDDGEVVRIEIDESLFSN